MDISTLAIIYIYIYMFDGGGDDKVVNYDSILNYWNDMHNYKF